MNMPRAEYPRPQFVRDNWLCLNGVWDFSFDINTFDRTIVVPYPYQSRLSTIDVPDAHNVVWYRKIFGLPKSMDGKNILLHFGAVDYSCRLWVNGIFITEHIGGNTPFEVDITKVVRPTENEICLQVHDIVDDMEMPRGKQYWKKCSESIFYTRTTGIWQSVWLEAVHPVHLAYAAFKPDIDNTQVEISYHLAGSADRLKITVSYNGQTVAVQEHLQPAPSGKMTIFIDHFRLGMWNFMEEMVWTPESPRLFDAIFEVSYSGQVVDKVNSYFGMRKVSIEDEKFLLNNRPYYQRLLLDQGYWPQSLLAAPDDEAYVRDIQMAKSMGFNGVRKHQKIEDPRFLYHADRLGFLVWGEAPAAYQYTSQYVRRITNEWIDAVQRDYSHPCIVVWVPLNESWGILNISQRKDIQHHSLAMLSLTKSLDDTRLVMSNDGWEHTCSDLLTIHDYCPNKQTLLQRYASLENTLNFRPSGRQIFANGFEYTGQPIVVSEFGGISFAVGENIAGWGYSNASTTEEFLARYKQVMEGVQESLLIQGFCYTQLYDVEQEINGLLTYDRQYKADPTTIREITEGRHHR